MSKIEGRDKLLELQSWLAEYEAFRHERLGIYRYQELIMETNIIAFAVIIGVMAMTGLFSFALALTMSVVSASLGLLWLAQDRRALTCSNYVSNRVAPALRQLTGNQELFSGEGYRYESSGKESVEKLVGSVLAGLNPAEGSDASSAGPGGFAGRARAWLFNPADLRGVIVELLFFAVPAVAGIVVGIVGMASSVPWYWYTTALFVVALVLATTLALTAWRWYQDWHTHTR